jgi:hypothetical protein
MNLAALAAYVCGKVRANDPNSIALCKGFLSARYQMIWDNDLWRDSLVILTATLDPTNAANNNGLDAIGVWLLPAIAEKVIAVRDHSRGYTVTSPEEYFQNDLDDFQVSGTALSFYILPRCVLAWGTQQPPLYAVNGTLGGAAQDVGQTCHARSVDSSSNVLDLDLTFTATSNVNGIGITSNLIELTSFTKQVTAGPVSVMTQPNNNPVNYLTLAPKDTSALLRCRIQLMETPLNAINLRALVKRTMSPFVKDEDVSALRGMDNVLIALAQADMLQEQRQYAKSQLLIQEGSGLLLEAKKAEVYQQAAHPRIIPAVEPPNTAYNAAGFQQKGYW